METLRCQGVFRPLTPVRVAPALGRCWGPARHFPPRLPSRIAEPTPRTAPPHRAGRHEGNVGKGRRERASHLRCVQPAWETWTDLTEKSEKSRAYNNGCGLVHKGGRRETPRRGYVWEAVWMGEDTRPSVRKAGSPSRRMGGCLASLQADGQGQACVLKVKRRPWV